MKPYEIIQQLFATNSRLEKIAILQRAAESGNAEFFAGVRLALDKDTKFYVKQVPDKSASDYSGDGLSWENFVALAESLSEREVTGNAAQDAIVVTMREATLVEWNMWYRPILRKDLRCGLDLSTLTAALGKDSEYHVDSFKCMLAKDSKDRLDKVLTGRKALDIKYDGVRTLAVYEPGKPIILYSRNGKVFRNFKKIEESLTKMLQGNRQPIVLDGEVVSASFNSLMTQVNRKSDANADDALYVMFDIVPLQAFKEGLCKISYDKRQVGLSEFADHWLNELSNITRTTPKYVDFDSPNGMSEYEALKIAVLEAGYEGLVVKDPDCFYHCKRHVGWSKIKPFIEVSLTVKEFYEGKKGTDREGTLGGFICEGVDDGKHIKVRVGGGFTDSMLADYWANKEKVIGMIAEVRADAISNDSDGNYSLRFPRFKCFRGFKKGEKI